MVLNPRSDFYRAKTISIAPQLNLASKANVLLLTGEAEFQEEYRTYNSLRSLEADFAQNTATYEFASGLFNSTYDIRKKEGRLICFKTLLKSPATSGTLTTVSLTSKLTALQAVEDGKLKIAVKNSSNETIEKDVVGLNFKGKTLEAIVTELQNKIGKLKIGVLVNLVDTDKIKFTNENVGATSTISITASAETGTDLTTAGLLDIANAVIVAGVNEVIEGETLVESLRRALLSNFLFTAVVVARDITDDEILAISEEIHRTDSEMYNYMTEFYALLNDPKDIDSYLEKLYDTSKVQVKTRLLYTDRKALGVYVSSYMVQDASQLNNPIASMHGKLSLSLSTINAKTRPYMSNDIRKCAVQFAEHSGGVGLKFYEPLSSPEVNGKKYFASSTANERGLTTIAIEFGRQIMNLHQKLPSMQLTSDDTIKTVRIALEKIVSNAKNNGFITQLNPEATEDFAIAAVLPPELINDLWPSLRTQGWFIYMEAEKSSQTLYVILIVNTPTGVRQVDLTQVAINN